MKIAILGWGSLIWQPKELKYDKEIGWIPDGPKLPIEFSRISGDGRLTLVIDKNALPIRTLYAVSSYEKLDEAILDLAVREKCTKDKIGRYKKDKEDTFPVDFPYKDKIKNWIDNTDCDAVIWTNLSKSFKDKIGLEHNSNNVIKYLETLPELTKVIAEEYIRKAHTQIKTEIRKAIEDKFQWYPITT